MATLNFSFAGESVNASRLESKVRKFDLEFENSTYPQLTGKPVFSVEYFFTINKYAEDLCEAFHLAARESGIDIAKLSIQITGSLDSERNTFYSNDNGLFNKVDVSLIIVSDAAPPVLEGVLRFARELNPLDDFIAGKAQLRFTLNSLVHLN